MIKSHAPLVLFLSINIFCSSINSLMNIVRSASALLVQVLRYLSCDDIVAACSLGFFTDLWALPVQLILIFIPY